MGNSREYLVKNRDRINAHRRERYNAEERRNKYLKTREVVLQKSKIDKQMCPMCRIDYNRRYLRQHLVCRHRVEANEAQTLINQAAI